MRAAMFAISLDNYISGLELFGRNELTVWRVKDIPRWVVWWKCSGSVLSIDDLQLMARSYNERLARDFCEERTYLLDTQSH